MGMLVIGHRGAPAVLPEHTLAGYRRAVDDGADVIEVDVRPSADGVLVARHDSDLSVTTAAPSGSTVETLPSAEVAALPARERWPGLRPSSAAHDGRHPVPRLRDVLTLAGEEAVARGRSVGVAVELKDVAAYRARGVDVVAALLADLAAVGVPVPEVPVWVLAFEPEPLRFLAARRDRGLLPTVHLVHLQEHAVTEWPDGVDAVGFELALVLPSLGARDGAALASRVRGEGRAVWVWTLRGENAFLPPALRRGPDPDGAGDLGSLVAEARALGVEGLVTDEPARVVAALSLQS